MCGIAGIISDQSVDSAEITKMTNLIEHRGPDGYGHENFCDDRVTLGHRRLSILDLSESGRQPMATPDGRYWITYNGEIFNYIELREELSALGFSFKTQTDTEVILAAYQYWGMECLNRFNGMWAFTILDTFEKSVFFARDRFGIKPFYYWIASSKTLYFASEIKQFTASTEWSPSLNQSRGFDFITQGLMDHTDETLFEGVFQLPAGHSLKLGLDQIKDLKPNSRLNVVRWYFCDDRNLNHTGYDRPPAEVFHRLIIDSVSLRMRSEVPVGSCLSGGLDSSTIVCVLNELLKKRQRTDSQCAFSAISEVKEFDESEYIGEVLKKTNIQGHSVLPKPEDLLQKLDDLIWHQDEPFGSTSIFAQWKVFELAKENRVTVMLDGQGADEQMAGYTSYFSDFLTGLIFKGKLLGFFRERKKIREKHAYNYKYSQILKFLIPDLIKVRLKVWTRSGYFDVFKTERWSFSFARALAPPKNYNLRNALTLSMTHHLPKLLHWEDRSSMAHGVESRVPFLDYRLVEFLRSLPEDFLIKDGVTKLIMREGMKGVLPEKIRNRVSKFGFVTAEENWLRHSMKKEFRDLFIESVQDVPLFTEHLVRMYDEMLEGKRPFDFFYWRVLCFCRWLKIFKVQIE